MLLYHHAMPLKNVKFGEIKPNPACSDSYFKAAYIWLEKEVGFYPLFLAVGKTEEVALMTGYADNWKKIIGSKIIGRKADGAYIQKNILRKKGEFPNHVLFSFEKVDGNFMDYANWHIVLNSEHNNFQITGYEKKLIFKYSWPESKWLKKAKENPHSVQLVAEKLYLPDAERIWTRNKKTKNILEKMGFKNVETERILTEKY